MYVFDEANLIETAEVVLAINPYTEGMTVENLTDDMKRTAYALKDGIGYVAIYGYCLSGYRTVNGENGIHASVSAYTVKKWMEQKKKFKKTS